MNFPKESKEENYMNENEQQNIGRLPPQAPEIEMAVLGAMMLEQNAVLRVIEMLDAGIFYKDANQKIFLVISALFERNEPIDIITVAEELKRKNWLEKIGGSYYLTECTSKVTSAANVEYHARLIIEKSILRRLISVGTDIVGEAYEATDDPTELLDRAEQKIFDISQRRLRKGFTEISSELSKSLSIIEDYHKRGGEVIGVPTGFKDLDALTSGFQDSDLIIIAGRPSIGKTAFCLNIARNAAVDYNYPVGIFSLEMASHQLAMRLLCSEARVSSHLVRTGKLPEKDWQKLAIAAGELSEAPIYIDDSASLGIMEILAKARRLKSDANLGMIVIDYLQLIRGPASVESRQQEIALISRTLKGMAKDLEIPVVALSQLSRAIEMRGRDKPRLSDLRESGALEQDADVVLFIHRPGFYKRSDNGEEFQEERGKAKIIIGKQRNGPTGEIELVFEESFARFDDLTTHYQYIPI